jgi:hypothetical protein
MSLTEHIGNDCDAESSIACAIQSVIAIGPHESFAPELPEFPAPQLVILTSADRARQKARSIHLSRSIVTRHNLRPRPLL